jgi:hypothetical protein
MGIASGKLFSLPQECETPMKIVQDIISVWEQSNAKATSEKVAYLGCGLENPMAKYYYN